MLPRAFALSLLCFCSTLTSVGSVRADDKKPEKARQGVVIDFSNWSVQTPVDGVRFQIEFEGFVENPHGWKGGRGVEAEDFAQLYEELMKSSGATVERFDKTKVRVLGWKDKKGVFRRAIQGTVTSKTLQPEQLPRVTNPPKA